MLKLPSISNPGTKFVRNESDEKEIEMVPSITDAAHQTSGTESMKSPTIETSDEYDDEKDEKKGKDTNDDNKNEHDHDDTYDYRVDDKHVFGLNWLQYNSMLWLIQNEFQINMHHHVINS